LFAGGTRLKHFHDIVQAIGNTPLVEYPAAKTLRSQVYLKLERYNPTLSVKDRMAVNMVQDAERSGRLRPGGTIIESSSGNTATSLAMIAAAKGYRFIAVMDDHASPEKVAGVQAFGGRVIRIKSTLKGLPSPDERAAEAEKLTAVTPDSVFLNQRHNPANGAAYEAMAQELLKQLPQLDTLVGTIGTGGTVCGTARALKQAGHRVQVVGVEPSGSTFFANNGGPYLMQGAGCPEGVSRPQNFDKNLVDEGVQVSDGAAFTACVFLAGQLGLLVGGSSGAAVVAALQYASAHPERTMAVILPDAGEKYASTIFSEAWRRERDLDDAGTRKFLTDVTKPHQPAEL
jgi:cystathionine beta-synthase